MELFTATGKLFFQLEMSHVCTTGDMARGKNLNIVSMCAVSPVVHTSNISSCQKKKLFQFSCGCEQFH